MSLEINEFFHEHSLVEFIKETASSVIEEEKNNRRYGSKISPDMRNKAFSQEVSSKSPFFNPGKVIFTIYEAEVILTTVAEAILTV